MLDLVESRKEQRKPVVVLSWIMWGSTALFSTLSMAGLSLGWLAILSLIGALLIECFSQYMKGWIAGYERGTWIGDEPLEIDPDEIQSNGATEEMNWRAHA